MIYSPAVSDSIFALVRHGHYERPPGVPSAHLPYPLSEIGRRQAKFLAARIDAARVQRGWHIDPLWHCSPLLRASETAQLAADIWSRSFDPAVTVQPEVELLERGLGSAANLSLLQIAARLEQDPRYRPPPPRWRRSLHYRLPFPGAESLSQAGLRVAQFLRNRAMQKSAESKSERPKLVVVIAHAGCLRFAAHHLGVLDAHTVSRFTLDFVEPLYIAASQHDPWRWVQGRMMRLQD